MDKYAILQQQSAGVDTSTIKKDLQQKGLSEAEILQLFEEVEKEKKFIAASNRPASMLPYALLALCIFLIALFFKQELGPFGYSSFTSFSSEGDFHRYNERVHKPAIAIIFLGHALGLLITNKPITSFLLKVFYYLLAVSAFLLSLQFADYPMLLAAILMLVVTDKTIRQKRSTPIAV